MKKEKLPEKVGKVLDKKYRGAVNIKIKLVAIKYFDNEKS